MTQQQLTKTDIINYVAEKYNYGISTYDYGNYVRITNGSAGFYADIHIQNDCLHISYRRETYNGNDTYQATIDGLQSALHDCLGL